MSTPLRRANRAWVTSLFNDILPDMVDVARGRGYALALHGSLARDIDIAAIPWVEGAGGPDDLVDDLVDYLKTVFGAACCLKEQMTEKPHGRKAYTIHLSNTLIYIDLSIMPRIVKDCSETSN